MQSGLLTDSFTVARAAAFAPDDWRRQSPQHQPPLLERNLSLRDALEPIATKHGVPVAAVAVAWTLAWPGGTAAIVGARSPEQVDGWLPAATLELDAEDLAAIVSAIWERRRFGADSAGLLVAQGLDWSSAARRAGQTPKRGHPDRDGEPATTHGGSATARRRQPEEPARRHREQDATTAARVSAITSKRNAGRCRGALRWPYGYRSPACVR
jgi:hypothetical protein